MTTQNLAKKERQVKNADLTAKNNSAVNLLNSWLEADENEQKETFDYLRKVLDEDRLSDRKLFK